jgi:hypothetical protein
MSESAPRVVADHRNGRISIVVERRRARHSRLRGVGLCDRGASAPRQQRGGGVTHAARPVSPPSRPRRAGPGELPTRCLYDNEGRSASAVRSQPECGCSTPKGATGTWRPLCMGSGSPPYHFRTPAVTERDSPGGAGDLLREVQRRTTILGHRAQTVARRSFELAWAHGELGTRNFCHRTELSSDVCCTRQVLLPPALSRLASSRVRAE